LKFVGCVFTVAFRCYIRPALRVLEEEESSEIKCWQRWRVYLTGALKGSEVKCYDFDEKAFAVWFSQACHLLV